MEASIRIGHPTRGLPAAKALAAAGAAVAIALLACRRVVVDGDSMRPTLEPGDRLLVVRGVPPRPGRLVAVLDPRDGRRLLVKRVRAVGPGGVDVAGDDPARSTDTRVFGAVPAGLVRGRPVYRYWPEARRGVLRGVGTELPSTHPPHGGGGD